MAVTDRTPTGATPDGRSSRWDEHRLARREELVDATLRAIRQHGAGVGMDEVAAAARTSKTVFYRHFTDRAGLYTAVAERVDATILRDLTRAAGEPVPGSARGVVRGVIAAYLRLVDDDPEVYRFIVNAPIVPPGERPQGDVAAGMTDRIATHVAELVAGGLGARPSDWMPPVATPPAEPVPTPPAEPVPTPPAEPVGSSVGSPVASSVDLSAVGFSVGPRVGSSVDLSAGGGLNATGSTTAPRLWGVALVGMVRATADAWLAAGGAGRGPSSEELADQLTTLAWDGLGSLSAER